MVGTPAAGQGTVPAPRQWVDSEEEDLEADWSSNVAADILQTLSDAEKKRQEIINGEFINCNHATNTYYIECKNYTYKSDIINSIFF